MFHKMSLPLLVMFLAIGSQYGAVGLHLNNGLDVCGEDRHYSCDSWVKSGECEKDPEVKQSCSFSCSLSGQLWEAARTGELSAVETTLVAGANPLCAKTLNVNYLYNYVLYLNDNYTAIHMAARAGHPDIIKTLLNASIDVNLQTTEGATPIHIAALRGSIDALDILIENNANVNIPDYDGRTPLMGAAYNITRALIKANASLDVTGGFVNATALYYAIWGSNQDAALLLIEHNANVNIPKSDGVTPLMAAANNGELNITRALIKANASLDVTGGDAHATALHYAVLERNQDMALLLIEHNANVNIPDSDGETPLMSAAEHGELNITRSLIKANASLDVTGGSYNGTALHYAVLWENQDVVLLLIERNANVNIPIFNGMTPLMSAVLKGELNISKALIKANASLDVTGGYYNTTALNYAVVHRNQDMALLLIENNANVNIPDSDGETPLMQAAEHGKLNITSALIMANASLDVTGGRSNATALYYAVLNSNQDVVLLLIENNANVNIPASKGITPLMGAAARGELNITRALLKANASLDVTGGPYNATALHYAVWGGNQDVAILLMDNGADSSITHKSGFTRFTPADLARSEGHNQLADLIESYPTTHRLILY